MHTDRPDIRAFRLFIILFSLLTGTVSFGADAIRYAKSDIRVLYIFDEPQAIDWGTLYYLNNEFGSRIDLLTGTVRETFRHQVESVPGAEIYLHRMSGKAAEIADSLKTDLMNTRFPDIVLFAANSGPSAIATKEMLAGLSNGSGRLFAEIGMYEQVDSVFAGAIVVNSRSQWVHNRDRIQTEVPTLFSWFQFNEETLPSHIRYRSLGPVHAIPRADFVSGLSMFRLGEIVDARMPEGGLRSALAQKANAVAASLSAAERAEGITKSTLVLTAYRDMQTLARQLGNDVVLSQYPDFAPYLEERVRLAHQAVEQITGLRWDSRIIVRDSPEGTKVKYRVSLASEGPQPVQIDSIRFVPYWDSTVVKVDSTAHSLLPHQSFVREYLIEIDPARLEAREAESLLFTLDGTYGEIPFTFTTALPVWETPKIAVSLEPNFYFIPPVAEINIDKVVASIQWRAIIRKPTYFHGPVNVSLETPRGMFAGAYSSRMNLEKGRANEILRIPFSVSNLFELGVQPVVVTVSVEGKPAAQDTGYIRIASSEVPDTIQIGFLPDSSGLLEDVLRMANVTFQPVTSRALETADLDAYDVLVIGSGAHRDYPNLREVRGRIEDFVNNGGIVVIMPQPSDWPENVLSLNLVPDRQVVTRADLTNRVPDARLLTKPYAITESVLLGYFERPQEVASAVASPAEKVFVLDDGSTVLSVTRVGDGAMIYCGLPLLDMIAALNIEAIHLFANLLNY